MAAVKKKILIVDDDDLLRAALSGILNKKYDIVEAANGRDAKNIIILTQFDLILSDIQMPFLTGVELLEWVKKNHPTKFVLMTGFSHLLETQSAQKMGADDFLTKPFSDNDLLESIVKLTDPVDENARPKAINLDPNFCKVPIEDFVAENAFEYDIFLRMNSEKYFKIAHKGGKIPQDRIQIYKSRGVEFFYISKEDFGKLVGFTLHFSKLVSSSPKIEKEKKDRFIRYAGEMLVQQAFVNGVDENSFTQAKQFTSQALEALGDDSQLVNVLNNFNEHADFLYAHSLAVSTFSVMIGQALGWRRPSVLFNLSLGGLFHDIGKKEISKDILAKSRVELTHAEREILETHPYRGKEILEGLTQIPSDVVSIAYEHHENCIESGYPRRLPRKQIHPLSLVVSVANVFANYTVKNPMMGGAFSAHEAIKLMERNHKDLLDEQSFLALKRVVASQK